MAEPSQEQVKVEGPGKSQQEINEQEWNNRRNWGGPRVMSVYFSKADSRIWVPKPIKFTGWTPNLAHAGGVLWFVGLPVVLIALMIILTAIIIGSILSWI
jgi:uncharacterized membrane protein